MIFSKDTYNRISIGNKQLFIPINMIQGEYSKILPNDYINACKFFGITLIDRTKTLDDGIGFQIVDEMLYEPTEKSFEYICFDKANSILDNAIQSNRNISLLWSGGIDSTTALLALYLKAKERNAINKINVLLSSHSIIEFENFFTNIIRTELKYQIINPPIYTYIDLSNIIVTGELGDQLFGSDFLEEYIKQGVHTMPYEEILPQIASEKLASTKDADALLKFLEPQIAKSFIPIKTLYDYVWWLNYSMKWQYVAFRIISNTFNTKRPIQLGDNFINFFQSNDFQKWALRDNSFKIKQEWESYKYIAKEFIHKYFQDEEYLHNKTKEQSLGNIVQNNNFSFLYKEDK